MSNTYDPTNDEEQSAAMPADNRDLLATTRPLVVAERTLPSWRGGELCRTGFAILSEPGDWRPEFILRRGEVFRSHESGHGIAEDEELATTPDEAGMSTAQEVEDAAAESIYTQRGRDSGLQIRICIGMS
jgi:hypothetical protein